MNRLFRTVSGQAGYTDIIETTKTMHPRIRVRTAEKTMLAVMTVTAIIASFALELFIDNNTADE